MKAKIDEYPDGRVAISIVAEGALEEVQLSIFEKQVSRPDLLITDVSRLPGYSVIRVNGGRVRSRHMLEAITLEVPFEK